MKVAILAGGLGTRLAEETVVRPKPMVEIGGQPLLWHILKGYAAHGYREFVVALGYKGEQIKDYFLHFHFHSHSLTVDLKSGKVTVHDSDSEDWTVHLLDTGLATNTGGRVKRVAEFVGKEPFMLTYGDGVGDVNIPKLLDFHRAQNKLVTLTAVRPSARFGQIIIRDGQVTRFQEKPQIAEGWINGGFFVVEPGVLDYLPGDSTSWELEALERIAADGRLAAYEHTGFWQCMDTLRDVNVLEKLWQEGKAPWKVWA
jgi:glucose-1-phosphate cytidylyltransferase